MTTARACSPSLTELLPPEQLDALFATTTPRFYRIGPLSIALHASDARLAGLLGAALEHARADGPGPCHIRVAALDTGRAGLPPPPGVPGTEHLAAPMDEVNLTAGGRILAIHQAGARAWESYDTDRRIGVLLMADAARIAPWEWASPLKRIIAWATRDEPFGLLHGAVIGDALGGVMLAGTTGVGKSTTTAAALSAGLGSAGDDVTMLSWASDGRPVAHAAFDAVKLSEDTLRLTGVQVPGESAATGPGLPKHIVPLRHLAAGRLSPMVPLRAILLPRLSGGARSVIAPASAGAALRALGPVSSFVMRVTPEASFALSARLVRSLPCLSMELGRDPAEAAGRIAIFLADGAMG